MRKAERAASHCQFILELLEVRDKLALAVEDLLDLKALVLLVVPIAVATTVTFERTCALQRYI